MGLRAWAAAAAAAACVAGGCRDGSRPLAVAGHAASAQAPVPRQTAPGRSPVIGRVEVGAFAPEAAHLAGLTSLSIMGLDYGSRYAQYREAIRAVYGADLSDMNYLSVGSPGWQVRLACFDRWLRRAGAYGAPTVALEPMGRGGFGVFADNTEMQALRRILRQAQARGTTVWVRFASESNLRLSPYTVYNNPRAIGRYRSAVRWFRSYMPTNTRLVFSPLINTVYLREPRQLQTIRSMYERGAYDRIGGTLYCTSWLRPARAYTWYHAFMRRLDARTPFQICELGGLLSRHAEMAAFLRDVGRGRWEGVERVNLFAGELNALARSEHGSFGFVKPGERTSFIRSLVRPADAAAVPSSTARGLP